ncbi:MAG: hypothetical protein D6814_15995 [Calditrichaeota bacterium]|nr:MAG: hypothetical protein D6814_15995 [Calditrichota bacterium]
MLAQKIGVGIPTLENIIDALGKPDRDPRDDMPKPIFRSEAHKIKALRLRMIVKITVRDVVDFGAFVDIGVK